MPEHDYTAVQTEKVEALPEEHRTQEKNKSG